MYSSLLEQLPDHCLELILDKLILDDFDNFVHCCKRLNDIGKGVKEMRTIRLHEVVKQSRPAKWRLLHHGSIEKKPNIMTPGQRFGSTLVYLDNSIYLFGGATVNWTTFNDLWRYDLKENKWSRQIPSGTCPPPRASGTGILYRDKLIIIGGFELMFNIHAKRSSNWDNLPWAYSFTTNSWSMITVDISKIVEPDDDDFNPNFYISPTPVGRSSCLMLQDQIILFGGAKALLNQSQGLRRPATMQPYSLSNRTLSLSLSTATVTRIQTFGNMAPAKRCGHSATAIDASRMLIVGGYLGPNTKGTEDMWMLTCFESPRDVCSCADERQRSSNIIWYWTEIYVSHPLQPLSQFIKNAIVIPGINYRSSTLVILGGASSEVEDSLFQNSAQEASHLVEAHRIGKNTKEEIIFKKEFRSIKRSNQIIVHSIDLSALMLPCETCGKFNVLTRKEIQWIPPLAECQDLSSAPNVRQGFSIVAGQNSIYVFGGLMYRSIYTRPIYLLNDLMIRDEETEDTHFKGCSDLYELTYRCSAILL